MAVSFNNIPAGIRVPLFYAEVDNSQANTATSTLKTLLVGQKLNSGKAAANKPVLVSSASLGKDLFGRGSMLAIMNSSFRANDTVAEVWAIPVADPTDGAKASATVTLSGEVTAAGSIYLYIGATLIQVNVAEEQKLSDIATAIANAITAKPDLPCTASAEKAVVTLSAKNAGTIGNEIPLALNLQGAAAGEETAEGLGIELAAFAGGTGTPDFSDAIAAMGEEQYDVIVVPYADTTTLTAFATEMNDTSGRWSPTRQLYGHVWSIARGSAATLATAGLLRNDQHCTVVGIESSTPSLNVEVLGAYAARAEKALNNDPARPLQTLELIGVSAAPAGSRFNLSERQTLLTSGVATEYVSGGYMRIERAITTYQKNALGDIDNSYLDANTLYTLAYVLRRLKTVVTSKYARYKLANDGTHFGSGQAVVTPSLIRAELIAEYQKLEEEAIVENADAFKSNLIVERDVNDPNRVNVLFPPDLVNQLRIFAVLAQFRLQY